MRSTSTQVELTLHVDDVVLFFVIEQWIECLDLHRLIEVVSQLPRFEDGLYPLDESRNFASSCFVRVGCFEIVEKLIADQMGECSVSANSSSMCFTASHSSIQIFEFIEVSLSR